VKPTSPELENLTAWSEAASPLAKKHAHRNAATGGSDPDKFFGRIDRQKAGSLPPNLVFFSVSLFSSSCRLFPRFPETYAHPKLKKILKLKCVIPTFFSSFAQILVARTERSFLLGWSDPRLTLGTGPCPKVGSLQPNSVPFRGHFSHSVVRNFFLPGHLLARQGEREGDG
jgi:hypothetical protein